MKRMVADIGGTHARFAWQHSPGSHLTDFATLACADFHNLEDAICAVLRGWDRPVPDECAIAIATPVTGDLVSMTNRGWAFSQAQLGDQFGFARLKVMNDFTALAWAIPCLPDGELLALGGGSGEAGAPIAVLGPGTGLGVSALVPDSRGGWQVLDSEGGHATLPACSAFEREVLARLEAMHPHVSAERVLSGQGLVNLHAALASLEHASSPAPRSSADEITQAALQGGDPLCVQTLETFCAFLGTVAGNLALTLGARGGVYIGGGIAPRIGALLAGSGFRERFEAKGRLSAYLSRIPVFLIQSRESPALLGAARALDAAPPGNNPR